MKGTVIESMKKTMFHRFGTLALSMMMVCSLMATPAFAAGDTPETTTFKQATLTINNAVTDATYRIVNLMTLVTHENADGDINGYEYTLANGAVGTAVKTVIEDSEFEARIENNAVTRTGFQLATGDRVVFRVVPVEGKTIDEAYADWSASVDGQAFMLKFSDKVKEKLEADGFDLDSVATKVKDGGASDTNTAANIIGVNLDYGYYMVISGVGQRAIICTNPVVGDAKINEKNDVPTLEKEVYEKADSDDPWKDKSDGNIGDLVYYQATIEAKTGLNHLTFKDTLSDGLDFVALTDVDFYPRSATEGVDVREVYMNAMGGATNAGGKGVSLLPEKDAKRKDPVTHDLTEADVFDWIRPSGGLKGITLQDALTELDSIYVDASLDGRNLTIDFDEIWLLSKRSDNGGTNQSGIRDDYKFDPIYANDNRVAEGTSEDDCAKYNQYLGDMSTVADDGGKIVISYVARLNSAAKIGEDGNKNTAHLEYGNNPTIEDETLTTPNEETRTYVYELDVLKYMTGDENTKLAGAEFEMRRGMLDLKTANEAKDTITLTADDYSAYAKSWGSDVSITDFAGLDAKFRTDIAIEFVKLNEGYRVKNDADKLFVKQDDGTYVETTGDGATGPLFVKVGDEYGEVTTTLVSNEDGNIFIKGLDADLYSLTETKAPDGCILADKPVYVIMGSVYAETAKVENDNTVVMSAYVQDDENLNQFNLRKEGAAVSHLVKIENASGLRMPETGGIGTTIFYIVGAVLVIGAGVLLVVKKRVGHGE